MGTTRSGGMGVMRFGVTSAGGEEKNRGMGAAKVKALNVHDFEEKRRGKCGF